MKPPPLRIREGKGNIGAAQQRPPCRFGGYVVQRPARLGSHIASGRPKPAASRRCGAARLNGSSRSSCNRFVCPNKPLFAGQNQHKNALFAVFSGMPWSAVDLVTLRTRAVGEWFVSSPRWFQPSLWDSWLAGLNLALKRQAIVGKALRAGERGGECEWLMSRQFPFHRKQRRTPTENRAGKLNHNAEIARMGI
jgi:hypothetical protein